MPALFGTELPTGRNGRLAAAGLLLLAVMLVWLVAIGPLIDWYGEREDALHQRMAYAAHMATIAADLPAARAATDAAAEQAPPPNMILAGASDAIASAGLESLIDGMTHDADATLISTEAIPAVQAGSFRRVGLHVTARASWDRLIQLLAAIDHATPRMSVGNIQIQAGPLGGPDQLLDMSMTVSAFRAGTESAEPAPDADSGDTSQ